MKPLVGWLRIEDNSASFGSSLANRCPDGGIGRRTGLKIPRRKACQFDSGSGHHF